MAMISVSFFQSAPSMIHVRRVASWLTTGIPIMTIEYAMFAPMGTD